MKLYVNCKILTCAGADFQNGYILTDNAKIAAVGDMENAPGCDNIMDLNGKTVCPGFVDAHSHIGLFHDSEEALYEGVTTVAAGPGSANPIGGIFAVLKTAGRRIDDMLINPYAAMKFAFGENPKKSHGKNGSAPKTRMATAAIIREALFMAQKYDGESFDMKSEALKPVLGGKMIVKAHAHRADDIFTALRIAKEFNLNMTIEHCTDGALIADYLAKEGITVCLGPVFGDRGKSELGNKSYKTAAGVTFALITDHPEAPQCELLTSARFLARHGISEKTALLAITANAAKAIGVDKRVGTVERGKDADFCVFTGDPMSFDSRIKLVVCGGEEYEI